MCAPAQARSLTSCERRAVASICTNSLLCLYRTVTISCDSPCTRAPPDLRQLIVLCTQPEVLPTCMPSHLALCIATSSVR